MNKMLCHILKGNVSNKKLGNFNANSTNWFERDKTTYKGPKIDAVTSRFGPQKLNKELTHIVGNFSRCFDLIFVSY